MEANEIPDKRKWVQMNDNIIEHWLSTPDGQYHMQNIAASLAAVEAEGVNSIFPRTVKLENLRTLMDAMTAAEETRLHMNDVLLALPEEDRNKFLMIAKAQIASTIMLHNTWLHEEATALGVTQGPQAGGTA